MSFAQRKQLVLTAWVATVIIVGIVFAIERPHLWMLVATLAIAPAAIGSWLWNAPEATLAQIIATERSRS